MWGLNNIQSIRYHGICLLNPTGQTRSSLVVQTSSCTEPLLGTMAECRQCTHAQRHQSMLGHARYKPTCTARHFQTSLMRCVTAMDQQNIMLAALDRQQETERLLLQPASQQSRKLMRIVEAAGWVGQHGIHCVDVMSSTASHLNPKGLLFSLPSGCICQVRRQITRKRIAAARRWGEGPKHQVIACARCAAQRRTW